MPVAIPQLKTSWTTTLQPAAILAAAEAGRPVELPLGARSVTLNLRKTRVVAPDADIFELVDGEVRRVEALPPATYEGFRPGEDSEAAAQLMITGAGVSGYVFAGEEWWFIEPLRMFSRAARPEQHLVYRTRDLRARFQMESDVISGEFVPSNPGGAFTARQGGTVGDRPIGVLMVADRFYDSEARAIGSSWTAELVSLMNRVNGIYRKSIGREFVIRGCLLVSDKDKLVSKNGGKLLDELKLVVDNTWGDLDDPNTRSRLRVEASHLVTGRDLKGDLLGIAYLREGHGGSYGLSQQSLLWVGGGGGLGGSSGLGHQNLWVAAHELGHNFNGIHDEADKWCVTKILGICWDNVRTLMWTSYFDDNRQYFSNGSRKTNRNNERRIRENMASRSE